MPKNERLGLAAAALGNAIFGFSFMFSRMALAVAHPFLLLMYRFLIAFALISIVALWARRTHRQGWLRFSMHPRQILPL